MLDLFQRVNWNEYLLIMSQGNPPIALQLLMVNAALVAYWFYRRTRTRKRTAPPPSGWTLQVMFLAGNLGVVMLGSRLSGYAAVAKELSPAEYLGRVKEGQAEEPLLSFQLERGFQVLGPLLRTLDTAGATSRLGMLLEWRARVA